MAEKNNVVLIGMPGSGKSTLGIVLAKIMTKDFIDADIVIQNQCDKTLQKIIDACGPEGFIEVENEILSKIDADTRGFISMTTMRPFSGFTANCTFDPPVSTPTFSRMAKLAARMRWYSTSLSV